MADILDVITIILTSMLTWISSIIDFSLSTPIIALGIYIPLTITLIAFVFSMISKLHHKKD